MVMPFNFLKSLGLLIAGGIQGAREKNQYETAKANLNTKPYNFVLEYRLACYYYDILFKKQKEEKKQHESKQKEYEKLKRRVAYEVERDVRRKYKGVSYSIIKYFIGDREYSYDEFLEHRYEEEDKWFDATWDQLNDPYKDELMDKSLQIAPLDILRDGHYIIIERDENSKPKTLKPHLRSWRNHYNMYVTDLSSCRPDFDEISIDELKDIEWTEYISHPDDMMYLSDFNDDRESVKTLLDTNHAKTYAWGHDWVSKDYLAVGYHRPVGSYDANDPRTYIPFPEDMNYPIPYRIRKAEIDPIIEKRMNELYPDGEPEPYKSAVIPSQEAVHWARAEVQRRGFRPDCDYIYGDTGTFYQPELKVTPSMEKMLMEKDELKNHGSVIDYDAPECQPEAQRLEYCENCGTKIGFFEGSHCRECGASIYQISE